MLRGLATARRAVASSSAVRPETPRLPAGDAAAVRPVASTRKFGAAASSFSQVVGPFIAGSRKTQVAVLVLRNRAAAAVHLDSLVPFRCTYKSMTVSSQFPCLYRCSSLTGGMDPEAPQKAG